MEADQARSGIATPPPGGERVWSVLQAAMARARGDTRPGGADDEGGRDGTALLEGDLELMARHVHAGTALPEMKRYTGLKRRVAQVVGRVVLYLAQVVTRRQVQFNLAATTACRDLAGELNRQADELRELRRRVRQLEAMLTAAGQPADQDSPPGGAHRAAA